MQDEFRWPGGAVHQE